MITSCICIGKCLLDKERCRSKKGTDRNSINSGLARTVKWFPLFATLFFFVLNRWKRKGSSQVEKAGRGRRIYFSLSLYRFLCAHIRGHPSTHRSIIPQKRGRNGQVGRYIPKRTLVRWVAPYRTFDISVPYPVGAACGKTFDGTRKGKGSTFRAHPFSVFRPVYIFRNINIASIFRVNSLHYLF